MNTVAQEQFGHVALTHALAAGLGNGDTTDQFRDRALAHALAAGLGNGDATDQLRDRALADALAGGLRSRDATEKFRDRAPVDGLDARFLDRVAGFRLSGRLARCQADLRHGNGVQTDSTLRLARSHIQVQADDGGQKRGESEAEQHNYNSKDCG